MPGGSERRRARMYHSNSYAGYCSEQVHGPAVRVRYGIVTPRHNRSAKRFQIFFQNHQMTKPGICLPFHLHLLKNRPLRRRRVLSTCMEALLIPMTMSSMIDLFMTTTGSVARGSSAVRISTIEDVNMLIYDFDEGGICLRIPCPDARLQIF
jgi:hypothetical protein